METVMTADVVIEAVELFEKSREAYAEHVAQEARKELEELGRQQENRARRADRVRQNLPEDLREFFEIQEGQGILLVGGAPLIRVEYYKSDFALSNKPYNVLIDPRMRYSATEGCWYVQFNDSVWYADPYVAFGAALQWLPEYENVADERDRCNAEGLTPADRKHPETVTEALSRKLDQAETLGEILAVATEALILSLA